MDNLSREMLRSGALERRVREEGLRGVTRKFITPYEALRRDLQAAIDRQRAAGHLEPLRDFALVAPGAVRD
jgi:hypothetical protein